MSARIKRELALVKAVYGEIDVAPDMRWFVIREWALAAGWNMQHTRLLVLIPAGYPITAPDNFFTDPTLSIGAGGQPGSTSMAQPTQDQQWLQFSYHIEAGDWQPEGGHDLLTFLAAVRRRLEEVS
jgi:hypothetical protein